MRFRIPNQGAQDLSGGIGNLFRSIAMAPLYEAEAADARAKADADLAYRGAQQRQAEAATAQSRAHAALFGSQQQAIEDQRQRGTLGELLKNAALMNGVPTDLTPDLEHRIRTGSLPTQYQAPVDGMGPVAPVHSALSPENVARVMRSMGLTNQALAVGDKSVENIAKATGMYREQGLGDDVLAGRLAPAAVGEAQAAIKGSKRIDNIGESGSGFNIFTGENVALDPRMQTLFQDKGAANIQRDKAAAGASGAAAGASTALRNLRQEQLKTEQAKGGQERLDLEAMIGGQPLPSSNRVSHGADSTNSKFRNTMIKAIVSGQEYGSLRPEERRAFLNDALDALGLPPVDDRELQQSSSGAGAGRGTGGNPGAGAAATVTKAPAGMKVVGRTPDGKIVYEDKSGKRFTD